MDLKTAGALDMSQYENVAGFPELCRFAEGIDVGLGPEFEYRRQDGLLMSCQNLVRQAEYANCKRKGDNEARASLEFVLNYLDNGFIPFDVFDREAGRFAKTYHTTTGEYTGECSAMAVVLELTIRREQRKLTALTSLAKMQNEHAQASADGSAPIWRITQASTSAKYNVDMVAYQGKDPVQGFQMEWSERYFDILEYQKPGDKLSRRRRELINENRRKSNDFVEKMGGKPLTLLVVKQVANKTLHVRAWGDYEKVSPLDI